MTRFRQCSAILASSALIIACASVPSSAKDIVDTAVGAGTFKTLAAALQAADLVDALKSEGPFTVFAPTDEAFAKLPAGTVESLLKPENKAKLVGILKYHVVAGRVSSADALAAGEATTLQGDSVKIAVHGETAMVNGAKLISTDIDASNGVIHVIDSVILPPEKQSAVSPRQMIESAIAEGSPLYNSGHAGECAKLYMTTAHKILAMDDHGMCSATMDTLQTALDRSQHSSCEDTQACTMRRALDVVYSSSR